MSRPLPIALIIALGALCSWGAHAQVAQREDAATLKLQQGAAAYQEGDYLAAVAAYREVLHGEPAHTGALAALGRLYENLQRPGDAEQALKTIADLHPNIAYHHYQLAQFYVRVGDAGKAKQAFARAESVAPTPRRRMRRLR